MLKNRLHSSVPAVVAGLICMGTAITAAGNRPVDIPERIKGSDQAVVATAVSVTPQWRQNAHGDQLIVSQIQLQVEETLKGAREQTVVLDLEGGTLGGLTLRVSDLPQVGVGERGVFFLNRGQGNAKVPHLRGLGILKLDSDDRVHGSSLRLEDIRQMARGGR